ncbi:MAG: DNA-protecting protein DprA [Bacteroidetes bacterium]|nr:DNA-protecting protein DprA [Bacteroidota bacterium]
MKDQLIYNIGITLLPGVGSITAKNLVAYCGSAEEVFKAKKNKLEKIPGIGTILMDVISNGEIQRDALKRAEEEIKFIEKENITPFFFTEKTFPFRLKQCEDAPVILYYKGNADLNAEKIISIVGTRSATSYGKKITEKIIEELSPFSPLIVSGLAYGIDIVSHRASLKNNLSTVAVLAHGLDLLYPEVHTQTAKQMTGQGGLLTEFISKTEMVPEFFPRRNRIVAGLSDATIVIESKKSGGSLITADIANSYNREVFAVPGRLDEISSEGCNLLIKANKAMLIQSAEDVIKTLNWDVESKKPKQIQQELFKNLSGEEELIVNLLKEKKGVHIDELSIASNLPMSKTASLLLNLEFSGVIKLLPGKIYELNN